MIQNKRKCIVTNKLIEKDQAIRVAKMKDGSIKIDCNKDGRGAYILKDASLIEDIKKKRHLHKVFKTNVDREVYEELFKIMEEKYGR